MIEILFLMLLPLFKNILPSGEFYMHMTINTETHFMIKQNIWTYIYLLLVDGSAKQSRHRRRNTDKPESHEIL